jgi:hypothetical protein
MSRTITDNPGGWSRSLPGHTVEYEPSFAQPFYYGTELVLGRGASSYYTLSFTDTAHIFFIDMIAICPQAYTELASVVYVNDVPYVAAAGIGWLNIPLRQNPSIQLIAGDHIDVLVVNQDGSSRNVLVKVNGTKIVRPANFGHAPGAYFTYEGPLGAVSPILLRAAEVSGVGNPAVAQQAFSAVDCSGISKSTGVLRIDLKASDPSILSSNNQLEVTSSGNFDSEELARIDMELIGLTTSYQTFDFPLSEFNNGDDGLVFSAIDYIRWYNFTTGGNVTLYWRNAYLYGVGNGEVVFTDGSTNSPTSWEWDFGDGSPVSNEQNPAHVYALPGSYYPRLKAGNAYGYDFYGLSSPVVVT